MRYYLGRCDNVPAFSLGIVACYSFFSGHVAATTRKSSWLATPIDNVQLIVSAIECAHV